MMFGDYMTINSIGYSLLISKPLVYSSRTASLLQFFQYFINQLFHDQINDLKGRRCLLEK